MKAVPIALIGDYDPVVVAHRAIPAALKLVSATVGRAVEATWVATAVVRPEVSSSLADFAGLWCVPGSPYVDMDGAMAAIRYARESGRPFLGTCGGFQHALIEYTRNVLGLTDADHAETCPEAAMPVVSRLSCSLVERPGPLIFPSGSRLRAIYGVSEAEELYHCNYGLNPGYEPLVFARGDLRVAGRDPAGEVRAVELAGHPFFTATLFQPERAALRGIAHPLITAFAVAAAGRPAC
jgi:CTP synthase (UTP-ammonia lyase)